MVFQDAFNEREVVEVDGAAEAEDGGDHSWGEGGREERNVVLPFLSVVVFYFI